MSHCAICLEDFTDDTEYTLCMHKFHSSCLQEYFKKYKYELYIPCPLCKWDIADMFGYRDPSKLFYPDNEEVKAYYLEQRRQIQTIIGEDVKAPEENADLRSVRRLYSALSQFDPDSSLTYDEFHEANNGDSEAMFRRIMSQLLTPMGPPDTPILFPSLEQFEAVNLVDESQGNPSNYIPGTINYITTSRYI
jgi:hypothetical protein